MTMRTPTVKLVATLGLVFLSAVGGLVFGAEADGGGVSGGLYCSLPLRFEVIHSPASGGTFSGGVISSTTNITDNTIFSLGTTVDNTRPGIQFNTTQTPDTGMLLTGTVSNHWVIAERQDNTFDFAHAATTDPTWFIQSHNQVTGEWSSVANDGTYSILGGSQGRWKFNGNANGSGNSAGFIDGGGVEIPLGKEYRISSTSDAIGTADTFLGRDAAATWQMGQDVNGPAVDQTLKAADGITGSDVKGGGLALEGGRGTGLAVSTPVSINRVIVKATGTTAQTYAPSFTPCPSKTLSNTSATAQTVAIIDLASNSAAGAEAHITVTCTDGTNFDSETVSSISSFVNKATVITVTSPGTTTATSAANNSGSCTIGQTWVAGTNQILLKVTPVFTTIVPTTVTAYVEVITHQPSATAVACQ